MDKLNPIRKIRQMVSQDRTRYISGNVDLDLTYITDNIIAMGLPASGLQTIWRNNIDSVAKFLKTNHKNHFMIWNLSEKEYDYSKFDNQLLEFGFPDHHSPPLNMLFQIIVSMEKWLSTHNKNVSIVHCVGGKGRTGTVIACYLLYSGVCATAKESLEYFAQKRSSKQKGVTQPSQLRYVRYFAEILTSQIKPLPVRLMLRKIRMTSLPHFSKRRVGCKPILKIYSMIELPRKLLFASSTKEDVEFISKSDGDIFWYPNCLMKGDIIVICKHMGNHTKRLMFRFSFHTAFVKEKFILTKNQLDGLPKGPKGARNFYDDDFAIELTFQHLPQEDQETLSEDQLETYEQSFKRSKSILRKQSSSEYDSTPVNKPVGVPPINNFPQGLGGKSRSSGDLLNNPYETGSPLILKKNGSSSDSVGIYRTDSPKGTSSPKGTYSPKSSPKTPSPKGSSSPIGSSPTNSPKKVITSAPPLPPKRGTVTSKDFENMQELNPKNLEKSESVGTEIPQKPPKPTKIKLSPLKEPKLLHKKVNSETSFNIEPSNNKNTNISFLKEEKDESNSQTNNNYLYTPRNFNKDTNIDLLEKKSINYFASRSKLKDEDPIESRTRSNTTLGIRPNDNSNTGINSPMMGNSRQNIVLSESTIRLGGNRRNEKKREDRQRVEQGKSVDIGGRRIKKITN
eukprot:TRINITY_DN7614_c0_g1_i1.p1 TRINITY_DN7614_c0_g1~~TRINITY_DN7614_c0_g1_i1.p1  ORF type:complete len:679 (-),score=154.91 TRINITY_DN7614_c0_g1_i1:367-2403(-)